MGVLDVETMESVEEELRLLGDTTTGRDQERREYPWGSPEDLRGPYFPLGDSRDVRTSCVSSTERGKVGVLEEGSSGPPVGTTTVVSAPASRRGDTTREDHDT